MNNIRNYLVLLVCAVSVGMMPLQAAVTSNQSLVIRNITPEISRGEKTLGDVFSYGYELPVIPFVPSIGISFEDPSGNEDILIVTQSVSRKNKGMTYKAKLIAFKTGQIGFPSVNIFHYFIEPLTVTIDSVIDQSTTINFQGDYHPYQDYSDIILGVLLVFLAGGLVILVNYYRRYQKSRKTVLTPRQKHALWEDTCACFKHQTLPDPIKDYYVSSSEKLKTFLKVCHQLDILDLTSREVRGFFKNKELAEQLALLECLDTADIVKFAKHIPTPEEFQEYQKSALRFLAVHEPELDGDKQ